MPKISLENEAKVPPKLLNELLRYEFSTGKLFWRHRGVSFFKNSSTRTAKHICNNWNSRWAGKEASSGCKSGRKVKFLGINWNVQRVIWAMVIGGWPENQISHINHDNTDNRIVNLKEVDQLENSKNHPLNSNNTSDFNGVFFRNDTKVWTSKIKVNGETKYLGCFHNKTDAIAARQAANIKYNFHRNHGLRASEIP